MMGPIRRSNGFDRSPVTLALIGGVLFGLILALARSSSAKAGSKEWIDDSDPNLMQMRVNELNLQIVEVKHQRDAARRQLADQLQLQKDLEKLLSVQEARSTELMNALNSAAEAIEAAERRGIPIQDTLQQPQYQCRDRHAPWAPNSQLDSKNPQLAAFLKRVAINNEVLVAVSNSNYARPGGMLELWMKGVKRAGVKNAFVVALDDATKANVEQFGIAAHRMDVAIPDSQKNSGSNHAVSALKFRILKPMLELGYSVLLSDVDIVTLKNPFQHLVRDSDVESLSDGWDAPTAYGFNDVADDPSMGWARYAHSMRIFVFNSGLFYLRPTEASIALLDKVIHRVETENGWDQALFNECIFFPNSPRNKDPGVTRRAMDIEKFMNSKFLFKFLRHDPGKLARVSPVMVHVNYHPDKFERMKAVWAKYVEGSNNALDRFPDGSE